MTLCVVKAAYTFVALAFSCFYGLKAVEIFTSVTQSSWPWRFHQRWLNFFGSIVGWVCLWFIGVRVWCHFIDNSLPMLTWGYAGLAFVAFVGVTGYLPLMVVHLTTTIADVAGKLSGVSRVGFIERHLWLSVFVLEQEKNLSKRRISRPIT